MPTLKLKQSEYVTANHNFKANSKITNQISFLQKYRTKPRNARRNNPGFLSTSIVIGKTEAKLKR